MLSPTSIHRFLSSFPIFPPQSIADLLVGGVSTIKLKHCLFLPFSLGSGRRVHVPISNAVLTGSFSLLVFFWVFLFLVLCTFLVCNLDHIQIFSSFDPAGYPLIWGRERRAFIAGKEVQRGFFFFFG